MAPKLTGFVGNNRLRRARAAAALAGVEVEYDSSFSMKSDWKTEEFLKKFPLGTLPTLEDGDLYLQESGAIAEYLAELGPNQTILPSDLKEKAKVHQWQSFADQEIFIKHSALQTMLMGKAPYSKPTFDGLFQILVGKLQVLDKVLLDRTFLVGERITLADVFVASALVNSFTGAVDKATREQIPNVVRYFHTIINHPKLVEIFDPSNTTLTDAPPSPPSKPKAEKAEKPKAEAAPKAPKAPKAAKPKSDDEEEPDVPAEPKQKNPLDDLPKSAFNLEEWKRQYSNLDTRKEALPWFYEKFDNEGFSCWRVDFKYNEELTQVFMSANQIGGFFNRLEASRKYLFGSVGVLGKANDSIITGALIARGQDIEPVINVAPDWESYSYKKLDLSNEEDKKYFEAALAWDLEIEGRAFADGKNFK